MLAKTRGSVPGLVLVALALAVLLGGCASSGAGGGARGPSDEELIQQLVDTTLEALKAQDIDTMVAAYADDFDSNQGMDKAGMVEFLNGAKEQGFLEGVTVDTSGMTSTIEGTSANVGGISLEGAFGVLDLAFKLEKRDGSWVITYQEQN